MPSSCMKELYPRKLEPDFSMITHLTTFISHLKQLGCYADPFLILSQFLTCLSLHGALPIDKARTDVLIILPL